MEITEIKPGMRNIVTEMVTMDKTAQVMGSGSMPVYATPAMLCLMEKAATELIEGLLPDGWTSVGCGIQSTHDAPSPVGGSIHAEAAVESVEGRKIIFNVSASDEHGVIGHGTHVRFAVQLDRFLEKALSRK